MTQNELRVRSDLKSKPLCVISRNHYKKYLFEIRTNGLNIAKQSQLSRLCPPTLHIWNIFLWNFCKICACSSRTYSREDTCNTINSHYSIIRNIMYMIIILVPYKHFILKHENQNTLTQYTS